MLTRYLVAATLLGSWQVALWPAAGMAVAEVNLRAIDHCARDGAAGALFRYLALSMKPLVFSAINPYCMAAN